MKPATIIAALQAGTATQDQQAWARRRLTVLHESYELFGLTETELTELRELEAALPAEEPVDTRSIRHPPYAHPGDIA
jgi:hypothetical protein